MSEPIPDAPPPPSEERLTALDLIRGVAVLGVLLANLPHFCGPEMARDKRPAADQYVAAVTQLVVDNKFITQLAILFGAGLAIQFLKARAAGKPFAAGYLWRQSLLYLLGLTHVVLLWFGDILAIYAAVSFVVCGVVLLGPAWEKGFIVVGLGWFYFVIVAGFLVMLFFGTPIREYMEQQEQNKPKLPDGDRPVLMTSTDVPLMQRFAALQSEENSVRVYRHGTFFEQAVHRLTMHLFPFVIVLPLMVVWYVGACFLIGVQLVRVGAFEKRTRPGWVFSDTLTLGFGFGLPVQILAVVWTLIDPKAPWPWFLHFLAILPLALGYLSLLTLWNETNFLPGLQDRFRAVGRMALTNYLVQSLISVWVFNNWGLGFYGTTGLLGGLVVVFGIWALELLWSPIWLSAFHMGPVEWAWRSLAALRPMPIFAKRRAMA